jgi:hypothetical protein
MNGIAIQSIILHLVEIKTAMVTWDEKRAAWGAFRHPQPYPQLKGLETGLRE